MAAKNGNVSYSRTASGRSCGVTIRAESPPVGGTQTVMGIVMSMHEDIESRRRFLKLAVGGAAAAALVGGLPRVARADDLPHVSESDPTAKALGYVEDASTTKDPKHTAGNSCANCQFYSGAATGYGPCQLFPGKSVSAKGWCISHTTKKA
jgi:hypothetical protein